MHERTKNGIIFLTRFLVGFIIFYGIVAFGVGFSGLSSIHAIASRSKADLFISIHANASAYTLSLLGTNAHVEMEGTESVLYVQDKVIVISALCTGWFEIALLIAAILATITATRRQQLVGIIMAIAGGFLFNQVRIVFSIQQILHTNLVTAELTHDVLFRLFMMIVVVGLYAGWLKWIQAERDNPKKPTATRKKK